MGVRGLLSFVSSFSIGRKIELENCKIVIDCAALTYYIIEKNKLDNSFGGESSFFFICLKEFIRSLIDSNIEVYVICDGQAKPELKEQTTISRRNQIINFEKYDTSSNKYSREHFYSKMIALACYELGCNFFLYEYEADWMIAVVANHLGAYIISNDSDFYIYNSFPGYVSLNSLTKDNYKYIGHLITSWDVASAFGIEQDTLKLYAVLCGNDDLRTYDILKDNCPLLIRGRGFYRMVKTLYFVKKFHIISEAVKEFEKYILPNHLLNFKKKVNEVIQSYNIHSDLEGKSSLTIFQATIRQMDCVKKYPPHLSFTKVDSQKELVKYMINRGVIGPDFYLSVNFSGKIYLTVPVQNLEENSVHEVDDKIRKILYKLTAIAGDCVKTVVEYDRFKYAFVEANRVDILPLDEIERSSINKNPICFMFESLNLKSASEEEFKNFKDFIPNIDFSELVVAINFIIANKKEYFTPVVLRSLLLSILKDIFYSFKAKNVTTYRSRVDLSKPYQLFIHFIGLYTCVMSSLDTLNELLICPLTPFHPKFWLNGPRAIKTFSKMSNEGALTNKEDDEYLKKELEKISFDSFAFERLYSACFMLIPEI